MAQADDTQEFVLRGSGMLAVASMYAGALMFMGGGAGGGASVGLVPVTGLAFFVGGVVASVWRHKRRALLLTEEGLLRPGQPLVPWNELRSLVRDDGISPVFGTAAGGEVRVGLDGLTSSDRRLARLALMERLPFARLEEGPWDVF